MSVLLVLKDPHSVLALHGCGSLGSLRSGLGTWGEGGEYWGPFPLCLSSLLTKD